MHQPAALPTASDPAAKSRTALLAAYDMALADGGFVKLVLRTYRGPEAIKSIDIRPVLIKGQPRLGFTTHYKTRDIVKNYAPDEARSRIVHGLETTFGGAWLMTTDTDLVLEKGGRLKRMPPSQTAPATLEHDRAKTRLIKAEGQSYLHGLKLTDAQGRVLKSAQDKYRQINRYIEVLSAQLAGLAAAGVPKVLDMGSGKGYLTFALYDYLANVLGRPAQVVGVEFRADMVALCNDIAQKSGFAGLSFAEGSIADFDSTGANMLIALHACDTATDDAIFKGISAGADLIVVAPCCHKQIRREMERHRAGRRKTDSELDFLLRHGIFMERQAEMVTDGLRALLLEYAGYDTKVFEFISDAHTPKNVMIVATRNPGMKIHDPALLEQLHRTKAYFGIGQHHLEKLLELPS